MKLGIMQPYFMPYIGYWQLMAAVDEYVIYDDVNYIKNGWVNRNRILINESPKYLNLQLIGASSNKLIKDIEINSDENLKKKNLFSIQLAYKKAPFYNDVYPILEKIFNQTTVDLVDYLENSFLQICEFLDINTKFIRSSKIDNDKSLKGQDKVIDICKKLHATEYYNAIGGMELYSKEKFNKENIELFFLKTDDIKYKQFGEHFEPNLSIIDVLMFNSPEEVKNILNRYKLV